jgi:hypothetical protein
LFATSASAVNFAVSIGVRETGSAAAIGANGGTTNGIEWINLDAFTLVADDTWQQFVFKFDGTQPITAFAGATANGILDGTTGTLEHIRIRNTDTNTDNVTVYIDDIVNNVGGTDNIVSGFETTDTFPATLAAQHMFLQPGFSGSTNGNIRNSPNTALVSDTQAHSGTQSNKVDFAFNGTNGNAAWLRLTTFNQAAQPNPTVNFASTSTLSLWMRGSVAPPSNKWTGPSGGNWNDPANWTDGDVPDSQTETANLFIATAPTTIVMDLPTIMNGITFDSAAPNGYTINGPETLTLSSTIGFNRTFNVARGVHTINAPIEVINAPSTPVSGWAINTTNAIDVMNTNGAITMNNTGSMDITKTGPGTWNTSPILANPTPPADTPVQLFANGGTTRLNANGGLSRVNRISVAGGLVAPTAKLDITNNPVVVDWGVIVTPAPDTTPIASIASWIGVAYAGGAWSGNGITSSNANASNFAVGYAEASSLTSIPAVFGTVDSSAVLIRLTRYGDADLSGTVNSDDFNALATNFGTAGKLWSEGNFNFDATGLVNSDDFNLLATNFGLAATGPNGEVTPQDWANLAAAVPEPSTGLLLAGLATSVASVRRRRHH